MNALRIVAAIWLALPSVSHAADNAALRPYVYRVLEHKVVDGDTVRTVLDLGFRLQIDQLARINGVDAPEIDTSAGKAVARYVAAWCNKQQTLLAVSLKQDKYAGRYLAELHGDHGSLADELLRLRLVRLYSGGARRPWSESELRRIESAAVLAIQESQRPTAGNATPSTLAPSSKVYVWVTDSGDKFHTEKCRYCDESGKPIELQAVLASGMEPCKVCKPPTE